VFRNDAFHDGEICGRVAKEGVEIGYVGPETSLRQEETRMKLKYPILVVQASGV
jgi:hypothetical protein